MISGVTPILIYTLLYYAAMITIDHRLLLSPRVHAISDATASIAPGIHLLLGENGSGKTTILRLNIFFCFCGASLIFWDVLSKWLLLFSVVQY